MSIIASIRQASALYPHAPAIAFAGQHIEYAEMLARVDGLSADLRSRGIGPGHRVAIHLERSPELVFSILATLACGAAYIPLDPEQPTARLREMITDSQSELILEHDNTTSLGEIPRLNPLDWS